MTAHTFTFIPTPWNTATPVEAHCECGVVLPALNGTDAMRVAKIHIEGEKVKEATQSCLCQHAVENFDGIHHDSRCRLAKEASEAITQ